MRGSYVSQFEHTILLRPTCKEVISRGDDYWMWHHPWYFFFRKSTLFLGNPCAICSWTKGNISQKSNLASFLAKRFRAEIATPLYYVG
jgi:hypothetical protein